MARLVLSLMKGYCNSHFTTEVCRRASLKDQHLSAHQNWTIEDWKTVWISAVAFRW